MSIRLMSEVWGKKVSGSEQSVLLALADFANDDGVCWPSQGVIGWKCGLTDRTVRSMVAKWKEQGVIEIISQGGLGRGKPSKIRLNLSKLPDKPPLAPSTYPEIFSGKENVTRKSDAVYPEIAVSDEPSINRQLISETNVSHAPRVSGHVKEDDNVLASSPDSDRVQEDDLVAVIDKQIIDDPSQTPEDRAACLLVRYTSQKTPQEKLGELGSAFVTVFGQEPAWKRLTSLRAKYGVSPVAEMIYRSGDKTIIGDPMDYITGALAKAKENGNRPKRIAWHPAGYRSEVDDADLTVSELWIKYRSAVGMPHVISVRERAISQFAPNHQLFEHRAHLSWATLANPGWLQSDAGKGLRKKYERDLRRANIGKNDMESLWETYCDLFVPAEYRDAIKETQIP